MKYCTSRQVVFCIWYLWPSVAIVDKRQYKNKSNSRMRGMSSPQLRDLSAVDLLLRKQDAILKDAMAAVVTLKS